MVRRRAEQLRLIRDRLVERAAAGSPAWAMPVLPSARLTANVLMTGCLLNRLPDEDASALCKTLLEEQNENGSWSRINGDGGNVSLSLEALHALSVSKRPEARPAVNKAVQWLEANRTSGDIEWETLLLLGAVTETTSHRAARRFGSFLLRNPLRYLRRQTLPQSRSLTLSYRLLGADKLECFGRTSELLRLQRNDGSWDGLSRTTVVALTALRHAGLPVDDTALERGWRFLRGEQHWSTYGLSQNPCDFSTLLHAAAVRSLSSMGTSPNALAGSVLSLLHMQRVSGGWGLGAQLSTDLFTTALAVDALANQGESPVETSWALRRAGMLLQRAQRRDGGWSLYRRSRDVYFDYPRFYRFPGSTDVTAMALIALAGPAAADGFAATRRKAVKYLLQRQTADGMWKSDLIGNDIFATSRAIEALSLTDADDARRAVLNGLKALRERQLENGAWGSSVKGTPAETAWAVRALQRVPGLYKQAIARARNYLMSELDESGLVWCSEPALFPIPYERDPVELWDLTTMWVLEAFSPTPQRAPRKTHRRSRSIFNKRANH